MSNLLNKAQLIDALERAVWTFVQAFVSALSLTAVTDLNWSAVTSAAIAGGSAVLALVKGMLDPRTVRAGNSPSSSAK